MGKQHLADLRRSLDRISILDLRRRIASLQSADLATLNDAAAAYRIEQVIDQYPFQIRPLWLNAMYRARRNEPGEVFSSASQLWCPPANKVTRPSRLNGIGQVRFYASSMPNTAVFELGPKSGDTFTVLIARTRTGKLEALNVAFVGLERALSPEVQHFNKNDLFRTAPHFRELVGPTNYKKWLLIDDYLSAIFGAFVPAGEEYRYKPTIALANLLFTAPKLDAVNYPSVATGDHGINVCMLPGRADELFTPFEAWMIEVAEQATHSETGELLWRTQFQRRSHEIGPDGVIVWRPPGKAIDQSEIMRFARRRVESLKAWPTAAPDHISRSSPEAQRTTFSKLGSA